MTKLPALAAVLSLALAGCERRPEPTASERWATTENVNVDIDWNKVNKAYEQAQGPEDLELKINEIYEGNELISVSVQDLDDKTQVVTGFFDKNEDGKVDEPEKIFTIRREITGEGAGQYATEGHGHYASYHSPMMGIMTGMLMGSMLSNAFSPRYVPAYTQPYTTGADRRSQLQSQRSQHRAKNPGRYTPPKPSNTGRSYGGSRGGAPRGGGRFGIRRAPGAPRPVRLTA